MYEKQIWTNGEVITQEKLNHIEDGISTGGGIYTYGEVSLFDGEVTTVNDGGNFAYAEITLQGELPKHDISVTFNGQNYTLPYGNGVFGAYWGELDSNNMPSFTNFPVFIDATTGHVVVTAEAGTYSLKINEKVQKLELNDIIADMIPETFVITVSDDRRFDKTYKQIADAFNKKQNIVIDNDGNREYIISIIKGVNPGDISSFVYDVDVLRRDYDTSSFKLRKYRATDADGFPIFIQDI